MTAALQILERTGFDRAETWQRIAWLHPCRCAPSVGGIHRDRAGRWHRQIIHEPWCPVLRRRRPRPGFTPLDMGGRDHHVPQFPPCPPRGPQQATPLGDDL